MRRMSKYSYIFESGKYGYFIYNAVTNSFVKIGKDLKERIEQVAVWDEEALAQFPKDFQNMLFSHKIIVNEQDDEDYYVKKKYAKFCSAFNTDSLNLTIATTTGCNLACPYCFEKGTTPISMNEEIEGKLVEFVEKSNVKTLLVNWYGGEPLLNFESIQRLSKAFKEMECLQYVQYSIVTNGYFLTEDKIKFFHDHNLKSIQITIDGLPETHNRLRRAKNGEPTFERITSNIDKAAMDLPDCSFNIRVNISKQNGSEYASLYEELSHRWKNYKNVSIYFAFVEDYGKCDVDCYNSQEKIDFIHELRNKYSIYTKNFYPRSSLSLCTANALNSYVVSANGDLYKCWSDIGKSDKIVGSLVDERAINYSLLAHYAIDMDKYDDEKCKNCFLYPVCYGGCPQHRYNTLFLNQKHDICPYESVNIDAVLEMIYEDFLILQRNKIEKKEMK